MSYPKQKRLDHTLTSKPKKRKFNGNQHQNGGKKPAGQSASARKLSTAGTEKVTHNPSFFYRIIEFVSVFGTLSGILIFGACKQNVEFQ